MCNRADGFVSLLSTLHSLSEALQMRMTVLIQLVQNASSKQCEMPHRGLWEHYWAISQMKWFETVQWEKRFDLLKWIGPHSDTLESERLRDEGKAIICFYEHEDKSINNFVNFIILNGRFFTHKCRLLKLWKM